MRQTEKKYWVNGYQIRGKNRKFWTFSIGNLGIMVLNFYPVIEFYSLI